MPTWIVVAVVLYVVVAVVIRVRYGWPARRGSRFEDSARLKDTTEVDRRFGDHD